MCCTQNKGLQPLFWWCFNVEKRTKVCHGALKKTGVGCYKVKGRMMIKKSVMVLLSIAALFVLAGCIQDLFFAVKEEPPVVQPASPPPPVAAPEAALPPAAPAVEERPVVIPVKPDAEVWEFLGRTRSGDTYYNKTATPVSGDIISVTTYKIITEDYRNQTIDEKKKNSPQQSVKYQRYEHNVRIDEIDCALKRYRVKKVTHVDDQGNVLDRYAYENEDWKTIPVLTELDMLREKLCPLPKKSKKKKR